MTPILYAHRGNIAGPNPKLENTREYVGKAIHAGFSVEVDLNLDDRGLYLGHGQDNPITRVTVDWLLMHQDRLLIHVKDYAAYCALNSPSCHLFFHCTEPFVFTSQNHIWAHAYFLAGEKSNCIIPLIALPQAKTAKIYAKAYGICSDYIRTVEKLLH